MMPGSASSTNTLLELTASELEAGGAFIGGTIEIEDLGASGQPGTVNVAGDLVLVATAGPITFQNTLDTIALQGKSPLRRTTSRTWATSRRLATTTSRSAPAATSASARSTPEAAPSSSRPALEPSSTAPTGQQLCQLPPAKWRCTVRPRATIRPKAPARPPAAAQAASIQDQLNAAEAAATAEAAAAVAAADQTTAAAFKAALNSIQNAVVIDNQAYQTERHTTQ